MFIEPIDPRIYEGSAEDGTLVIHQTLEKLIRQYPEHYHWSYKRFSANPALKKIYDIDENTALIKLLKLSKN
jgi:KDO2-lipid IV(A) lauroyltransferase